METSERSLEDHDFVVVDLETTGFAPERGDRIVEIAMLRCRPGSGIVDRFTTIVDPRRTIGAQQVHGLRTADVRRAPCFEDIAERVRQRIDGGVVVAHNARFDVSFLVAELTRAGHRMPSSPTLCTMRLAGLLDIAVPGRSLHACCRFFDIPVDEASAHGAARDAEAAARLLLHLLREARAWGISSIEELGCEAPAAPSGAAAAHAVGPSSPTPAAPRVAAAARRVADTSPITSPDRAAYLELLDRVLLDRVITEAEADALAAMARRCRLGDEDVAAAHREYVDRLADVAWEDGALDDEERRDLVAVGAELGASAETMLTLIDERRPQWTS